MLTYVIVHVLIVEVAITAIKYSVFTGIPRYNTIELRYLSQLYIPVTETNVALSVTRISREIKTNSNFQVIRVFATIIKNELIHITVKIFL